MVKPNKINKDTDAIVVLRLLFGKDLMLKSSMSNIGLSYGLKKATVSGNYVSSQATANSNYNKPKTTGLKDCLMNI